MGSRMIKLSIIIVEYYSVDDVLKCVSTVNLDKSFYDFEIIISSNSLYDKEQCRILLSNNLELKWIFNKKNGGFAYAMNEGLKRSSGDLLVVMNPDTQILTGLGDMAEFILSHETVGAIAPQLIDSSGIVQDSFRNDITMKRFLVRHFKRLVLKDKLLFDNNIDYSIIQRVDWVIGAFIMVKREIYLLTNGFDDKYFLYCEDMDWCKRIRLLGYEIIYFPHAIVEYVGSRTARRSLKFATFFLKSLFRYWFKFSDIKSISKKSYC